VYCDNPSDKMTEETAEAIVSRSIVSGWIIPFLWRFGTVVGGLLTVAVGLLYAKQDSLLYFPAIGEVPRRPGQNPRGYRSPAEHQIPYETHMIRCSDGVSIHSWLLLHPHSLEKKVPTLLFFHGNAGNIGLRLPNALQMFKYLEANVLMVEYRGYGDSDDCTPSEAGLKLDAEAALQFIRTHTKVDPNRIFAFGRSLGGAVAFHLAQYAERNGIPLAGILVENTFLSISSMVDALMPFVAPLKPLVLTLDWNSGKIAPQLRVPVLYLAGKEDELVPPYHMQELYEASAKASPCARIHVVERGTHNDTWLKGGKRYWEVIRIFLSDSCDRDNSSSDGGGGGGAYVRSGVAGNAVDVQNEANAIPLMPTNLVGMAKEATVSAAAASSVETGRVAVKKDL